MTIICITGHCGSGKSEAAKSLLEYLPNASLINGDKYMFQWMTNYLEDFKEIFGIPKDICDIGECAERGKQMTSDQFTKFIHATAPFIERNIEEEISKMHECNKSYLIIEWLGVPMFKIWERSEYRILVNSSFEQRSEKLLGRTFKEGRPYRENPAVIRTPVVENILKTIKNFNFILNNSYNESFSLECKLLCDKILARNN
jgi:dephospho-CoA kinase